LVSDYGVSAVFNLQTTRQKLIAFYDITLQVTHESKRRLFSMNGKERITIVSFPDCIQEKRMRRHHMGWLVTLGEAACRSSCCGRNFRSRLKHQMEVKGNYFGETGPWECRLKLES
jgi:hypothetical protein